VLHAIIWCDIKAGGYFASSHHSSLRIIVSKMDSLITLHGFGRNKGINSPKYLSSCCCSGDDIESGLMDATGEKSIRLVFGSDDLEAGSDAEEPLESSVNSSRSEELPEASSVLGSPHDIQENASAEDTIARLSSIIMMRVPKNGSFEK
jgi:hypothetical protein